MKPTTDECKEAFLKSLNIDLNELLNELGEITITASDDPSSVEKNNEALIRLLDRLIEELLDKPR